MIRPPSIRLAGLREEGVPCPGCAAEIVHGEEIVACTNCGSVHHVSCWESNSGCSQFDCTSAVLSTETTGPPIRITTRELETAQPLPVSRPPSPGPRVAIPVGPDPEAQRWNKLAIASFVIALLSFPLFGIVTGLLAVAVGALSLIGRNSFRRKGLPYAAAGIMLGICSFVGWVVYFYSIADPSAVGITLNEFEPDPKALDNLPAPINRAMKANVLITTGGILQQGLGSGVILRIKNDEAIIVTNRHVIDFDFAEGGGNDLEDLSGIVVKAIGQTQTPAKAVWLAPEGIDLALITMPVTSGDQLKSAWWDREPHVQVGDPVFAIGNPRGLGWTHTSGDVSQLRRQRLEVTNYGVIQTSAAINSGNSGGGLYDDKGRLIGINTWTQDKRFAEGLGFAIVFQTLFELLDGELDLPERHLPIERP